MRLDSGTSRASRAASPARPAARRSPRPAGGTARGRRTSIERPPYIANVSRLPTAKLRRRNRPSGSIGSARARLVPRGTRRAAGRPPSIGHQHLRRCSSPTVRLADQRRAPARRARTRTARRPRQSTRRVRRAPARAPGTATRHEHERDDDERDVDGEDQPPRRGVDQPAADERADDRRDRPPTPSTSRSRRRAPRPGRRRRSPPARSA